MPDANSLLASNDLNSILAGLGTGNPSGVQSNADGLQGLGDLSSLGNIPGLNTNLMDSLGLNLGGQSHSGLDGLTKMNSIGSNSLDMLG